MALLCSVLAGAVWAQPALTIHPDPQPARPGEPYRIICEVAWSGESAAYAILPAEVQEVDWGKVNVVRATSEVRDGINVVSQVIEIKPAREGTFQTPAIEIPFRSPGDVKQTVEPESPKHPSDPETLPKLRADQFPLLVQPHTTPAWLPVVLGALFFVGTAAMVLRYGRRKRPAAPAPAVAGPIVDRAAAEAALLAAKRCRIEGDFYRAYGELARAAGLTGAGGAVMAEELGGRAQSVGYRGVRPGDDEIEGDFKQVERAIAALGDVRGE
jgi:hypothetical protein